jgi:hypothetical protein
MKTAMVQQEQATTPKALWTLVVVPPIIAAIEMQTNFVLVRQACSAQRNTALYAVIIVAIVLTVIMATIAFSIWKRAGAAWPTDAIDVSTRIRFIAILGVLSSAMSFLLILAQGIATVHFDPCQW